MQDLSELKLKLALIQLHQLPYKYKTFILYIVCFTVVNTLSHYFSLFDLAYKPNSEFYFTDMARETRSHHGCMVDGHCVLDGHPLSTVYLTHSLQRTELKGVSYWQELEMKQMLLSLR